MWVQTPPAQPSNIRDMWFISDTHLNHANILEYCDRPFKTVKQMDEAMIQRWNEKVHPKDLVVHLGDVGFHYENLFKIIPRLNGYKQLVLGNHDWGPARMEALGFECLTLSLNDHAVIKWSGREIILAHRPRDIPTWTPNDKRVRLCGHEHTNAPQFIRWVRDKNDEARPICALNLCVEHWDYSPVHVDEVLSVYDNYMKRLK
ncbi:MAG: metallophosphoesterase family protein [Anaerolineae bacterium]|nr:metallophosphoesterase family protein [Anaerolineae bacterium]